MPAREISDPRNAKVLRGIRGKQRRNFKMRLTQGFTLFGCDGTGCIEMSSARAWLTLTPSGKELRFRRV